MPSHYDTPKRCRIKCTIKYLRAHQIKHNPTEIATFFGGSRRRLFSTLAGNDRSFHNIDGVNKTRGRKRIITGAQVAHADRVIEEAELEMEEKSLSWGSLGIEIDADCHPATVRRTIHTALNAHKRIVVVKQWLPRNIEIERMEYAKTKLREVGHQLEDWKHVRWSDEVHGVFTPLGPLRIIRKPNTRLRCDNIQRQDEPPDKDRPRKHAWCMIEYNYKSRLYFYTISTNKTGKMTNTMYVHVLHEMVKPCLDAGEDFILEEDRDRSYGVNAPINGSVRPNRLIY
jgi:hypothetical protein